MRKKTDRAETKQSKRANGAAAVLGTPSWAVGTWAAGRAAGNQAAGIPAAEPRRVERLPPAAACLKGRGRQRGRLTAQKPADEAEQGWKLLHQVEKSVGSLSVSHSVHGCC